MTYEKFKPRVELQKLARGKKTNICIEFLAGWALEQLAAAHAQPVRGRGDEVQFLTRLWMLPDPRTP